MLAECETLRGLKLINIFARLQCILFCLSPTLRFIIDASVSRDSKQNGPLKRPKQMKAEGQESEMKSPSAPCVRVLHTGSYSRGSDIILIPAPFASIAWPVYQLLVF